jgi:hypothetical protein
MVENYKKFDWSRNSDWQLYLANLTGIKSYDQLEKYRRKWYQRNIDKNFDINF